MKRLIVLRHAKSSWKDSGIDDRDRPLNGRGKRTAPLVGEALRAKGWLPEVVLCSDARRARDTYQRMAACFPNAELEIHPELYAAGIDEVAEACAHVPSPVTTVMVVGHNPGWEDMVSELCGFSVPMTTGNAALLAAPDAASLADAFGAARSRGSEAPPTFRLVDVIRPRDLER